MTHHPSDGEQITSCGAAPTVPACRRPSSIPPDTAGLSDASPARRGWRIATTAGRPIGRDFAALGAQIARLAGLHETGRPPRDWPASTRLAGLHETGRPPRDWPASTGLAGLDGT